MASNRPARIVLIVIALGAVVYFWWLQQQLGVLRDRARALRDELGYLEISDPKKIYVGAVKSEEQMSWRWKLYVPDTGSYSVRARTTDIAHDDSDIVPGASVIGRFSCPAGLHEFSAFIEHNYPPNPYSVHFVCETIRMKEPLPDSYRWRNWASGDYDLIDAVKTATKFGLNKPIVLLRLRAKPSFAERKGDELPPGLLIWLDSGP